MFGVHYKQLNLENILVSLRLIKKELRYHNLKYLINESKWKHVVKKGTLLIKTQIDLQ